MAITTFSRWIDISWTVLRRVSFAVTLLLLLAPASQGAGNCDLNSDGQVNVIDVQMGINQTLGVNACTSADINADGQCNVVDVQLLVNTALGAGCPAQLTPDPTPSAVWVTPFSPSRVHYVSTNGTGSGTIDNPESFATALSTGHYQCKDLHVFRGGTYGLSPLYVEGYVRPDKNCSESSPAVFKGYVAPDGQPEQVRFVGNIRPAGTWNWFVGIEMPALPPSAPAAAINIRAGGVRIINSIIHSQQYSTVEAWNTGPGQVLYGNITYLPGCVGGNEATLSHNFYTQNNYNLYGYKYFVQNITLETTSNCGGYLFHAYAGSAQMDSPVQGYWLQDNLFGDAPNRGSVLWSHDGRVPASNNVLYRNYFLNFYLDGNPEYGVRLGRMTPFTGRITHNYFARTVVTPEGYWGASDSHDPYVFTDNEVYDPTNGNHIAVFNTRANSGAVGSQKIQNSDVWDRNTYGGTFRAQQLFCGGSNQTNLAFAQWQSGTNNCRVTPGSAGFDRNSSVVPNPTTNKVVVLKNEYQCPNGCPFTDQARGNVYLVNWTGAGSQTVNISSVAGSGKRYVVRYARDFFGTPAASGTCPGSGACEVSLPTRRTSSESSGRFVNAYVITAQP